MPPFANANIRKYRLIKTREYIKAYIGMSWSSPQLSIIGITTNFLSNSGFLHCSEFPSASSSRLVLPLQSSPTRIRFYTCYTFIIYTSSHRFPDSLDVLGSSIRSSRRRAKSATGKGELKIDFWLVELFLPDHRQKKTRGI